MIYFIHAPEVGRIKIGFSKDWQQRFLNFMVGCPTPLDLLVAVEGSMQEEKKLQRIFGRSRYRGEWFTATADLVDFCHLLAATEENERRPIVLAAIARHERKYASERIEWDFEAETMLLRACTKAFVDKHGPATTAVISGLGPQIVRLWRRLKATIGPMPLIRLMAFDPEPFAPFWRSHQLPHLRALQKDLAALLCEIEAERDAA